MMRPSDFQIRPLEPGDFEIFDDKSRFFMEFVKLNTIQGEMYELYQRRGEIDTSQVCLL